MLRQINVATTEAVLRLGFVLRIHRFPRMEAEKFYGVWVKTIVLALMCGQTMLVIHKRPVARKEARNYMLRKVTRN